MFTEPFPAFPSMFDGPFTNVAASQASQAGERIIPIKVVSSKSDLQQVETERQEGGGAVCCNQIINSRTAASATVRPEITELETSQLR